MRRNLVLAALLFAAPILSRADGVTDFLINPATGIVISVPGSYRLAGDVVMTNGGVNAILINVDNVTIDLNGHTIDGGGVGSTGGRGISGTAGRVHVKDGRFVRFHGWGIVAGATARVSGVTIVGCGGGIVAGIGSIVEDCVAEANVFPNAAGTVGINVGDESSVRGCVANANTSTLGPVSGIYAGDGCIVTDCTASNNTSTAGPVNGIRVGIRSSVVGCTAGKNATTVGEAAGIRCGTYPVVTGNNVYETKSGPSAVAFGIYVQSGGFIRGNTCNYAIAGSGGTGYGIYNIGGYCSIEGNACDYNRVTTGNGSGCGILVGDYSRVAGNTCTDNDGTGTGTSVGIIVGGSGVVEHNHCAAHDAGAFRYGIRCDGGATVIRENTLANNQTAGIRLAAAGNRVELNRSTHALSDAGGNSIGVGDLANTP